MFKVAWRNLWRNRRRTILTSLAIGFAVLFLVFMLSIEHGTYEYTKDYATKIWNGKARIFRKGYFRNETLGRSFILSKKLKEILDSTSIQWCKRIDGFGLVSFKDKTYGASISGIQPEREISRLRSKIVKGRFLNENGEAVVGWRLAKNLGISIGDKIAALVQGRDGSLGAKLFKVTGIFKSGVIELDREKIIITLQDADEIFSMGGRITTVVLYSKESGLEGKLDYIRKNLPDDLELIPWQKIMPDLLQMIEFDRAGAYMMYLILVIVVAFGLLNTMFMSVMERRKEMGVLRAIGLSKSALKRMIMGEGIFLSAIGVILGEILSLPAVYYFHENPIKLGGKMAEVYEAFQFAPLMPALFTWKIFLGVGILIFVFAIIMSVIPAVKITSEDLSHQIRFEK